MGYRWVVAALCIGAAGATFAQDAIKDANRQVRFVGGGRTIEYHEYDNSGKTGGAWLDSEKGTLPSVGVAYVAQGDALGINDLYLSAGFDYARGKLRYDGFLQDAGGNLLAPYQFDNRATMTDFEAKIGKGFRFANGQIQLTPYIDYTSHAWKRGSSRDQYSSKEAYEYQSIGLGLLSQYAFSPRLVGSVDVSYGRTISPRVTLEDDFVLNLKSEPVTSLGFGLDYKFADNWRVYGAYRLKKFKYGQSDWKYYGTYYDSTGAYDSYKMEPTSKSTFSDVSVGVGYSF